MPSENRRTPNGTSGGVGDRGRKAPADSYHAHDQPTVHQAPCATPNTSFADSNCDATVWTYDPPTRLLTTKTHAARTRTFAYDAASLALSTGACAAGGGAFNGKVITQLYEDAGGTMPGRFSGVQVATSAHAGTHYAAGHPNAPTGLVFGGQFKFPRR